MDGHLGGFGTCLFHSSNVIWQIDMYTGRLPGWYAASNPSCEPAYLTFERTLDSFSIHQSRLGITSVTSRDLLTHSVGVAINYFGYLLPE